MNPLSSSWNMSRIYKLDLHWKIIPAGLNTSAVTISWTQLWEYAQRRIKIKMDCSFGSFPYSIMKYPSMEYNYMAYSTHTFFNREQLKHRMPVFKRAVQGCILTDEHAATRCEAFIIGLSGLTSDAYSWSIIVFWFHTLQGRPTSLFYLP